MRLWSQLAAAVLTLVSLSTGLAAEETRLFNGKDLQGWTFLPQTDDQREVDDPWIVQRGLLISRGVSSGYFIHQDQFENYVLTLEFRTMSTEEGGGVAVGSLGSVYVNAVPEIAEVALKPKSIEISLHDEGDVYLRDIDRETFFNDKEKWVFRAPDFAGDIDHEMGEWNHLRVLSIGDRLTVIFNNKVVNHVAPINRTKGSVGLVSYRGIVAAPTFYRNIVVRPIGPADAEYEKKAIAIFAQAKSRVDQRKAAEEAQRAREAAQQEEAEKMQAEQQQEMAKAWTEIETAQDIEFTADVRRLPFPKNARALEFSRVFDTVEFESPSSLAALSKFYAAEMARRGWKVTETDIEEDEVTVTFQQGDAEVELNLDASSDGVDVSMDCEELAFEGTDDPAGLVKLGVPQPQAYLVLQREFKLPASYRDHEYDAGERRLFKSTMKLPELYELLANQLRQKGYRESRRPIVTADRRYSEFVKGGVEISVNAFAHEIGSRVVLSVED